MQPTLPPLNSWYPLATMKLIDLERILHCLSSWAYLTRWATWIHGRVCCPSCL